jgi:outer membrane protein TolC
MTGIRGFPPLKLCIAATVALAVTGCAMGDEEGAFGRVNALIEERTDQSVVWHRDEESEARAAYSARNLLAEPLDCDGAVRFAFLRNPEIQASLAEIGISEADVAQAGRLRNPVVSLGRLAGGGVVEVERQILFSLMSLFTIEARTRIAEDRAERARYQTALEIVSAAGEVRTAWVEAVAARERVALMDQIFASADAADELARRMAEAGSMPEIDQAQIKASLAEIAGQRGQMRAAAEMARERLIRAMGVWGEDLGFTLPDVLPPLPGEVRDFGELERVAISKRLDIRAARKDVEGLARTLELTEFTAILNLLEVGLNINTDREPEEDATIVRDLVGFEFEFEIPIFDPGDARISRANWTYTQAVETLKALAITARSEAREAYVGYRASLDLARHYRDILVPLRAMISEEELLRYNGMLASVFELLAATRQHAQASMMALDARRDFWLADGHMDMVLLTGSSSAPSGGAAMEVAGAGEGGGH